MKLEYAQHRDDMSNTCTFSEMRARLKLDALHNDCIISNGYYTVGITHFNSVFKKLNN